MPSCSAIVRTEKICRMLSTCLIFSIGFLAITTVNAGLNIGDLDIPEKGQFTYRFESTDETIQSDE